MSSWSVIRKSFPLIIAMALLFSMVTVTHFTYLASGNMLFPEQAPRGISITRSGTVEGTDKIQASGDTYTLTGDLDESIAVLRDGIVLNGAGYTLRGSGSGIGIFLRNHVTIKNLKIANFQYGIKMTWLIYGGSKPNKSVIISGNNITGNEYGIAFLQDLPESEISNNYFADNTYAVYSPNEVTFKSNQFKNNDYCIYDELYSEHNINDVDTSNTVNGKPIYYWVNQQNETVPSNAGWVVLKNCKNITIQGLNLDDNGGGLLLYKTSNSTINGNVIAHSMNGITLQSSNENIISSNHISGGKGCGIHIAASDNNNVSKNEITANSKDGILIEHSNNNIVTGNQIVENDEAGIVIKVYQASGDGVTTLSQNYVSRNGMGVWINNAVRNTVVLNNISDNYDWGIKLEGTQKDNIIHHNNLINNNVTQKLQVCITGFWNYTPPHPITNGSRVYTNSTNSTMPPREIEFIGGSANFWDNGNEGNYWSDYTSRYPNATEKGSTGVGTTPFYINENNMDCHPLMAPVDTSNADVTLPIQPTSQDPQAQQDSLLSAIIVVPIASVAIISTGLVMYFKKYRIKRSLSPSAL